MKNMFAYNPSTLINIKSPISKLKPSVIDTTLYYNTDMKTIKDTVSTHYTTGAIQTNGKPFQIARSIKYGGTNGVLLWDEYDVDKIAEDGTVTHFLDYAAGTDYAVNAICDDGTYAYWITNILNTWNTATVQSFETFKTSPEMKPYLVFNPTNGGSSVKGVERIFNYNTAGVSANQIDSLRELFSNVNSNNDKQFFIGKKQFN